MFTNQKEVMMQRTKPEQRFPKKSSVPVLFKTLLEKYSKRTVSYRQNIKNRRQSYQESEEKMTALGLVWRTPGKKEARRAA